MRAVVAVAGGIDVPQVLGSRSTCVSARFGGFQGRRLQKGDVLSVGEPFGAPLPGRANVPRPPAGDVILRAMPGPQEDLFDPEARAAFWAAAWRVLPESNRMGIRLRGESLGFVETVGAPVGGNRPRGRPDHRGRAADRPPRRAADDGRLPEDRDGGVGRSRPPRPDGAGPDRAL